MLKDERHDALAALVDKRGTATVRQIADTLGVSDMTIRRDLDELSEAGRVERIRGGARALARGSVTTLSHEYSHAEKRRLRIAEKQHAARLASGLIADGDTVFLGPGTTIELMVGSLPSSRIRVITNSLPVFNLLDTRSDLDLCLVGGIYRPRTGAFVGPMAEEAVSTLGIDRAFIGANGVIDRSISTSTMEEGKVQQLVLEKADERYLVADSSKVGRRDFYSFYDLAKLDAVITDGAIEPDKRAMLETFTKVIS